MQEKRLIKKLKCFNLNFLFYNLNLTVVRKKKRPLCKKK